MVNSQIIVYHLEVSVALGATDATPAFDLTDATNYPTSSLSGNINLTSQVSGTLPVANGGTGLTDISTLLNSNNTIFKTMSVSGQSDIVADSATDTLTLVGSGGAIITTDASNDTITITTTDTQLADYQVQDIVGAMFSSNTETGITATYQNGDGTIDLVVGTLNQDTTGTASKVVVSDSTSNTDFPIVFNDESNALLDDTGSFTYNPSSGDFTIKGGNLKVKNTGGTTNLSISTAGNIITDNKIGTATDQEYIAFDTSNEVNTFINNTERLSVTASGADITGSLTISSDLDIEGDIDMATGKKITWVDDNQYISGTSTGITIESDNTLVVNSDTSSTFNTPTMIVTHSYDSDLTVKSTGYETIIYNNDK